MKQAIEKQIQIMKQQIANKENEIQDFHLKRECALAEKYALGRGLDALYELAKCATDKVPPPVAGACV